MRAAQYIDQVLDNPIAAQKLVDDTEKAILERLNFAESFEPYTRDINAYTIYSYVCFGDVVSYFDKKYSQEGLAEQHPIC